MSNNESTSVDFYLQSLLAEDIPKLTIKEEHELAEKIADGDTKALDKLIKHNLRFVVHVITKSTAWQHSSMPQEDLLAMGNEALFMAGRSWKPTNNASFATYAKPFIERGVRRELDNTENIIRLPVNIRQNIKRLSITERALFQVLNRKPKVSEISKVMGLSEIKIHQLRGYINREPLSLDTINQQSFVEESHDD